MGSSIQLKGHHLRHRRLYKIFDSELKHQNIQWHLGLNTCTATNYEFRQHQQVGYHFYEFKDLFKFTAYHYNDVDFNDLLIGTVTVKDDEDVIMYPHDNFKARQVTLISTTRIGSLPPHEYDMVVMLVCQHYRHALKYVKVQTDAICHVALRCNSNQLEQVHDQTPAMCRAAILVDPYQIRNVRNQTEDLSLLAVSLNGMALVYVKDKTLIVCQTAYAQNPKSIRFTKQVWPDQDWYDYLIDFNTLVFGDQ